MVLGNGIQFVHFLLLLIKSSHQCTAGELNMKNTTFVQRKANSGKYFIFYSVGKSF